MFRLCVKTIAIGLAVANSLGVMWNFVLLYMFNPDEANLSGKVGFIFGGLCFPSIAFLWWFQPATKGRSYEEFDETRKGARDGLSVGSLNQRTETESH